MDIQINAVNFACRTRTIQPRQRGHITNWLYRICGCGDTFTRTTFNIDKDLKKSASEKK